MFKFPNFYPFKEEKIPIVCHINSQSRIEKVSFDILICHFVTSIKIFD